MPQRQAVCEREIQNQKTAARNTATLSRKQLRTGLENATRKGKISSTQITQKAENKKMKIANENNL